MRWIVAGFSLALAVLAAAPASAKPSHRYPPIDECSKVPGAAAFRASLAKAVRQRDSRALLALTAKDIKLDFGGGGGTAELRKRLVSREGRKLWRALADLLPLGCTYRNRSLVMPSLFSQEFTDVDPMTVFLVTGKSVPMHAGAEARSRVVASLTWDLVAPVEGEEARGGYSKVRVLDSGKRGYVATAKLRSPIDYRIIATKKRGRWLIEMFVAGD